MTIHLAFDTCALIELDHSLENIGLAVELYKGLGGKVRLLVDTESGILKEYFRNLESERTVGRLLIQEAIKNGAVDYFSPDVSRKCLSALDADGFDLSDRKFVGVAQAASGFYVTTETKHLEPTRCELVEDRCAVKILGLQELRTLLGGPS